MSLGGSGHDDGEIGPPSVAEYVARIPDHAVITLDPQGQIETWNVGAEAITGYAAAEILGHHHADFYRPEDRAAAVPLRLLDAARSDGHAHDTGWRVRADGTQFWASVSITSLHDDAGRLRGYCKVTTDLTAAHAAEEALRISESRFRLLVSEVSDYAIISLDPQGTIESWNVGAAAVTGYEDDEILGQHVALFSPPDDRRDGLPLRLLDEARSAGHVTHTGWQVRKDGTRFWGDVVLTAVHGDDGRLSGFSQVTRDQSERRRLDEERERFLRTVVHDLKSPITSLKGFISLLPRLPVERHGEILPRIDANIDRLSGLVSQMIDYGRLDAGSLELTLERVDLYIQIRRAVEVLGPVLSTHPITYDIPADETSVIVADVDAVDRVLTNLLTNAAKYSPPHSPISIRTRQHGEEVHLSIRDSGRGIHPDDLPSMFGEFQRGRMATDDGGTGLGLASVKRLVERMGGRVALQSVLGVGTEASVFLPAMTAESTTKRA